MIKIIKFNKPTHWTENRAWVNLRADLVQRYAKRNDLIVLELPEGFTEPIEAKKILKCGKKTEAVFLYPDKPMKLLGMYFSLLPEKKQREAIENPFFWEVNYLNYQL